MQALGWMIGAAFLLLMACASFVGLCIETIELAVGRVRRLRGPR